MISLSIENYRFNHLCKYIYNITKPIKVTQPAIYRRELLSFLNKFIDESMFITDFDIINSIGLMYQNGDVNGITIQTTDFKIVVMFAPVKWIEVIFSGTFIHYMCVLPVQNSTDTVLHIITDTGIFMYRGEVKLFNNDIK